MHLSERKAKSGSFILGSLCLPSATQGLTLAQLCFELLLHASSPDKAFLWSLDRFFQTRLIFFPPKVRNKKHRVCASSCLAAGSLRGAGAPASPVRSSGSCQSKAPQPLLRGPVCSLVWARPSGQGHRQVRVTGGALQRWLCVPGAPPPLEVAAAASGPLPEAPPPRTQRQGSERAQGNELGKQCTPKT